MTLKEKLYSLPEKSGVYIMKNKEGKIIYVGKAKILKNRVRQYFGSGKNHSPKVKAMVSNIDDFEYIITTTEREAFVLECNLIKEHRPKYNILLKDDKTYPFIKISSEAYPRVSFSRIVDKDSGEYFGPYTSAYFCREMIELTEKIFHLPLCKRNFPKDFGKKRPCLYYSMGRCMGVCTGKITQEEYAEIISEVKEFIKGNHRALISNLKNEMEKAAEDLNFEKAADIRDKINSVKYILEKQSVSNLGGSDADIFALSALDNDIAFEVLNIRDGRMTGRESYFFEGASGIDDEFLMSDFLTQYYEKEGVFVPPLIITNCKTDNLKMLENHLSEERNLNVEIRFAIRGKYKELASLAQKNAEKTLYDNREQKMKAQLKKSATVVLGKILGLENAPSRIEAYDISHISGDAMVGSMVVFENGKYSKKDSRFFKIKTQETSNDTASLAEVLTRRFGRLITDQKKIISGEMDSDESKFALLPDLILMDGGKGQVRAAKNVLDNLGIEIPVFGMVKDERHRTRTLVSEEGEIYVNPSSPEFRLIASIQDEAHRLAVSYHHKLKENNMKKSPLLNLKGVGEKTYEKLMKKYKTISGIKAASKEELCAFLGKVAGDSVYEYFRAEENEKTHR